MAAIKYAETFKRKASLAGYILKGFYYQYSVGEIYASESETISQLQRDSLLHKAMVMPTPEGFCLTMNDTEIQQQEYKSIRLWCEDLMTPDVNVEFSNFQYVGAIEFHAGGYFKPGVNNMVLIKIKPNCTIILVNDTEDKAIGYPPIDHIVGSDMDKGKYANATDKNTFLEMPCAKRLLMDDVVSRTKKNDVFQIATSGLIKI